MRLVAYMIRLLSCMDAHVALERLQVAEVCPADLTWIRFLARVDQHVGTKVGDLEAEATDPVMAPKRRRQRFKPLLKAAASRSSHLHKPGTARLALVWLLSRVDAGVGLEVSWTVELSSADVAVVRLCTWKWEETD